MSTSRILRNFSSFIINSSSRIAYECRECLCRKIYISNPLLLRGTQFKLPESNLQIVNKPEKVSVKDIDEIYGPADPAELSDIGRNLSPTYNFAAYVNQSDTLQKLVQLGVDLHKLENKPNIGEFIMRLKFDRDIAPYVQFFHDNGVPAENIGNILTKNILICKESMENLKVRINYLESKKFSREMIAAIIMRNPKWLTTPTSVIDGRLGWFQKTYNLTGDQVRKVVNELPQIITFDLNAIKLNNFVLEMELGMTSYHIKSLLLKRPRIFVKNQNKLIACFEWAHNVMKVPLKQICAQPDILMERIIKLKERHLFLQSLGRAQYNPKLPGYISLDQLIKCDDAEFITNVAKSNPETFNLFLKTL